MQILILQKSGIQTLYLESCKASRIHITIFVGLFHKGFKNNLKTLVNHSICIFLCNKLTLFLMKATTHLQSHFPVEIGVAKTLAQIGITNGLVMLEIIMMLQRFRISRL